MARLRPDRHLGAEHGGEVGRGADRLGDQPRVAPGRRCGPPRRAALAAPVAPAGRVGEPDLLRRGAELAARLGGDLAEHQAEHLRRPASPGRRGRCGRRRRCASGWARSGSGPAGRGVRRRGRSASGRRCPGTPPTAATVSRRTAAGAAARRRAAASPTVFDVPKSIPSTRMPATLLWPPRAGVGCRVGNPVLARFGDTASVHSGSGYLDAPPAGLRPPRRRGGR